MVTIRMIRVSVVPAGYASRADADSTTAVPSGPTASRVDDVPAMPATVRTALPATRCEARVAWPAEGTLTAVRDAAERAR
jgi:hypothetical protein